MLAGVFLICSFSGFCVNFRQLKALPENFACLYLEPISGEELEKACRRQQLQCQVLELEPAVQHRELISGAGKKEPGSEAGNRELTSGAGNREQGSGTGHREQGSGAGKKEPETGQIALVYDMKPLDYQRAFQLLSGSDETIDVNLLKWITAVLGSICLLAMLLQAFCCYESWGCGIWAYGLLFLCWWLYLNCYIFADMPEFPVWSLPGSWSDFEGWGEWKKEVGNQICCMIRFWDDRVISRYCRYAGKSLGYLLVTAALFRGLCKNSSEVRETVNNI